MPGFHLPKMEFPLRNTKEVIELAGLPACPQNCPQNCYQNAKKTSLVAGVEANLCYSMPTGLMSGVKCQEIKVKKFSDAELSKAVETGCQVMLQRTAGSGFPILLRNYHLSTSSVKAAVQRVVGAALLYTNDGSEQNEAKESEVEEWLEKWKRGEERRALVTDDHSSRGWEAPAVMVIGEYQTENLVMRTCGLCFMIKIE